MPSKAKKTKLPPDHEGMNDLRALRAREAIEFFGVEHGEEGELETNLVDLLTDIAHLCDREGLQLATILNAAKLHYDAETNSKGKQEFDA